VFYNYVILTAVWVPPQKSPTVKLSP